MRFVQDLDRYRYSWDALTVAEQEYYVEIAEMQIDKGYFHGTPYTHAKRIYTAARNIHLRSGMVKNDSQENKDDVRADFW